jgi:hypothetical protein
MKSINEIRSSYPTVSLKRICDELGLCYQYVLKASKQPIAGAAYDPDAFNDEAVAKIVERKGADTDSIDWAAIAAEAKATAPVGKPEDFTVGTNFKLRESKERQEQGLTPTYAVLAALDSYVVFVDTEHDVAPRVMNWDTFLHQSPRKVAAGE